MNSTYDNLKELILKYQDKISKELYDKVISIINLEVFAYENDFLTQDEIYTLKKANIYNLITNYNIINIAKEELKMFEYEVKYPIKYSNSNYSLRYNTIIKDLEISPFIYYYMKNKTIMLMKIQEDKSYRELYLTKLQLERARLNKILNKNENHILRIEELTDKIMKVKSRGTTRKEYTNISILNLYYDYFNDIFDLKNMEKVKESAESISHQRKQLILKKNKDLDIYDETLFY